MAPMCMYACDARDGVPTNWHVMHLGARAAGGCGLVITEATAVQARGRISLEDVGIWNDAQREAWRPVTAQIRELGAVPVIQLAHAGRKAGTRRPWEPRGPYPDSEFHDPQHGPEALAPVGPSALAFADAYRVPIELDDAGLEQIRDAFVAATLRAVEAGFLGVELHMAHGYLLQSFLSPLCNLRTDRWGGDFDGRVRFPLTVCEAVRKALPDALPLLVRISATDWAEGGWDLEQSVALTKRLRECGVDVIDVSSGGAVPHGTIGPVGSKLEPGYQVPFAARIRSDTGVCTAAVGLITEPQHAQSLVEQGSADLVLLGRELLRSPHWAQHAAAALGAAPCWPRHYDWAVG